MFFFTTIISFFAGITIAPSSLRYLIKSCDIYCIAANTRIRSCDTCVKLPYLSMNCLCDFYIFFIISENMSLPKITNFGTISMLYICPRSPTICLNNALVHPKSMSTSKIFFPHFDCKKIKQRPLSMVVIWFVHIQSAMANLHRSLSNQYMTV